MRGQYILEGKIPIPCEDLLTWGRWLEEHFQERIVQQDTVGAYWVSTVFIGLDHNFSDSGPPLLFETMVFKRGTRHDLWQERSSTWELAREVHLRACTLAQLGFAEDDDD
jgi:hypothetical protein